jgi:hypothetical protein
VALGEGSARIVEQAAEDGNGRARATQELEMAGAADAIADEGADCDSRLERCEAVRERSDRTRHSSRVAHERDWSIEDLRDFGARARELGGARAVVQAHHALDERDVGSDRVARERLEERVCAHEPTIQVVRGLAAREAVIGRIEVVRPALEHRDPQSAAAQCAAQADGERGLADAARHTADQEARDSGGCGGRAHAGSLTGAHAHG